MVLQILWFFSIAVKNENLRKYSINPYKKVFHPYSQWMIIVDHPQLTSEELSQTSPGNHMPQKKKEVRQSLGDGISYVFFLSIHTYVLLRSKVFFFFSFPVCKRTVTCLQQKSIWFDKMEQAHYYSSRLNCYCYSRMKIYLLCFKSQGIYKKS